MADSLARRAWLQNYSEDQKLSRCILLILIILWAALMPSFSGLESMCVGLSPLVLDI